METAATNELPQAAHLVVLLSDDHSLIDTMAEGLAALSPSVELHRVGSPAALREHAKRASPDAVVIDVDCVSEQRCERLQESPELLGIPIVMVGRSIEEDPPQRRPVARVKRRADFVGAVHSVLQRCERIAGHRFAETVQHYRDILEASSDGVFVLTDGTLTYVNESFAAAVTRARESLVGQRGLLDLVEAKERAALKEKLDRIAVQGGKREILEVTLLRPDGQTRRFEISCSSSIMAGRRTIVGVARDVTAIRQLQDEIDRARQRAAQIERLRALGELAAGVAHDFNNTLEAVLGRVQLAKTKLERGEPVLDDLRVVEEAARNAEGVVRRIREFSRPSGSDSWHDVQLESVARDALSFINTRIPGTVKLLSEVTPTPAIRGNGAELREVLVNLLANALDAVELGGAITLRCYTDGCDAVVEVEDDGCGMPEEVQRRMYEPFFSTKANAGTGLGLSVSHGILRRHDAQVELRSDPGKGTLFRIRFEPIQSPLVTRPARPRAQLSVAVVDDDGAVAELVSDLLQEMGHEVRTVQDPDQLSTILETQQIDLLITDLDLNSTSGWQLARQARQAHPSIQVGLITGWPLSISADELACRGVDFVLSKPFTADELQNEVKRLVSDSEPDS